MSDMNKELSPYAQNLVEVIKANIRLLASASDEDWSEELYNLDEMLTRLVNRVWKEAKENGN